MKKQTTVTTNCKDLNRYFSKSIQKTAKHMRRCSHLISAKCRQQAHNEKPLHTHSDCSYEKTKETKSRKSHVLAWMQRKWNSWFCSWGCKWCICCAISTAIPQKIKHGISIGSSNFPSGYKPKGSKAGTWIAVSTSVFMATSFISAKRWKQPKGLPREEQIDKGWYVHTVPYYAVWERRKVQHILQHGLSTLF